MKDNIRLLLSARGKSLREKSEFPLYETRTYETFRIISAPSQEEKLSRYVDWIRTLGLEEEDRLAHIEALQEWLGRCARHNHTISFSWM